MSRKRALVVGINDYPMAPLRGCVTDAKKMHALLSQNGDGSANFSSRLLTSENAFIVTQACLAEQLEQLLMQPADGVIFYFSGHGSHNILGGYLITQDAKTPQQGYPFRDLQTLVLRSPVREIAIVLDCCYSGAMGNDEFALQPTVELREGVTIMAASQPTQLAAENQSGGIFTSLVVDALGGMAADITGNVTLPSIYNYVDSLLTPWDQNPLFKCHLSQMSPLRKVNPKVPLETLRQIPKFFPQIDSQYQLDPEFEKDKSFALGQPTPVNLEKEARFEVLQNFRNLNLVEPCPPHTKLYYAAIESGRCKLTQLGQFYWRLASRGMI